MQAQALRALLERTLRASILVPLAVACGGSTLTRPDDAGPAGDAGARDGANEGDGACGTSNGACMVSGCGGENCSVVTTCVDGQPQCSCECLPLPDSGAGNPCNAMVTRCGPVSIPLSCFDAALPEEGGAIPGSDCPSLCGSEAAYSCSIQGSALQCNIGCPTGRAFAGMARTRVRGRSGLRRHFVETATLEAAAVDAFLILAGELEAHGAPPELVAQARTAARDEARHWRMTRPIALRYGACPKPKRAAKRPVRDLASIAIENAVEGCVRETFGALVAHHQAMRARDREVRAVMSAIADDETRHAALGWAVAAWAEERMTPTDRARVRRARRAAVAEIARAAARPVPEEVIEVAGVPDAATAKRMVAGLERSLWGGAQATAGASS